MCATMGGFCPYPAVPNYSVIFPEPRPANTSAPAVSGKVKTVLHLSDIHVDPLYARFRILVPRDAQPGTEANCQFPICCRDYENQTTPLKWGDYFCDTPALLLENLLDAIPKIEPIIDFAITTG
ncbi:hypothetical protein BC936DRAFT_136630 [Jimgerdemannia flammicorona]|uniref:Calcineurin-like phosphoesterase domain-containing protein n=1 Tax=Jimgerdemannia flammicorona TaxID=994334 RepID=A0A433DJG4_9FUNG|nr:hypothetical protein BC936DRAFT_136630 [Jimgerdemannia flammicorona]